MISNLCVLLEEFEHQILKYSMRRSLQHWTESSITPNSKERSVWRNKKPQKRTVSFVEDRSLTWSTSTSGSLEPMIPSRIVPTYLQSVLRNDDIQEFDPKWDGILLSMTKIPHYDILEGLYKLRIRESEKLKTVLELYDLEIHQKKLGPDYHRLKTMVKRSIEQNLRIENFEARNGNYERNAVVKNQGTKQREQRTLGDCWQWWANGGSVLKETIAVSVTMLISVQNRHSRTFSEFFAEEWQKCF